MHQSDFALTVLGSSPLAVTAMLALVTGAFCLSVLGYLTASSFFQSRRRRGRLSGDGTAFALAGVLFLVFAASYLEVFALAFRLPFSAYQDLAIGLGAVTSAIVLAQLFAARLLKRQEGAAKAA